MKYPNPRERFLALRSNYEHHIDQAERHAGYFEDGLRPDPDHYQAAQAHAAIAQAIAAGFPLWDGEE